MIRAIIQGTIRANPTPKSGNGANGAWSFLTQQVLDADDNKVDVTLPDDAPPSLQVNKTYALECDFSVGKGYQRVQLVRCHGELVVDEKTGEFITRPLARQG